MCACVCVQEETLALRKEGIGVVLDSELPHLIGIDDDLLSTGIILYHLKVRGRDTDQPFVLPEVDKVKLYFCVCVVHRRAGRTWAGTTPPRSRTSVSRRISITKTTEAFRAAGVDRLTAAPCSLARPGPGERTLHVRERRRKSHAGATGGRSVFGQRGSDLRAVTAQPRSETMMSLPAVETPPSAFATLTSSSPPGAVILLGRTNMFRFNHPKEAAKLREKRKVKFGGCGGHDLLRVIYFILPPSLSLSPSIFSSHSEWPPVFTQPLHD